MKAARFVATAPTIGAVIRDERKAQRLTLSQLAQRAQVSRGFLVELEDGHPRAALGKVLAVFGALGLTLSVEAAPTTATEPEPEPEPEVEQTLAAIEKGQRLAGHFPSDEAVDRARRVLQGDTTLTDARAELAAKYDRREK